MTPPLFRVPSGAEVGGSVALDGSEGHHASDVLRLRSGEPVWLTDGAGSRWDGVVSAVRRGSLDVEVTAVVDAPPQSPRLVAVQALAKGGRDELAVEAMTEVGVDEVVGWQASRSIAKWTDRTAAKWQSAADAAARQARRVWWPTVGGPVATADLSPLVASADVALVMHEDASRPLADVDVSAAGTVLVVVGPEGGITDDEVSAMVAAGASAVRLGDTVLRSSTAGVAALSAICARTRWT